MLKVEVIVYKREKNKINNLIRKTENMISYIENNNLISNIDDEALTDYFKINKIYSRSNIVNNIQYNAEELENEGETPKKKTFGEKVSETVNAVLNGADEIDIVLALNHFLAGEYDAAAEEIVAVRKALDEEGEKAGRKITLKVILETGLLAEPDLIARASFLAMEAGADFIKTSTGKVEVNATPTAALVMCECIRLFNLKTGRKVGFKAAGGISNAKDALEYYHIVSSVLGEEWLNKELFRFGVSRLGNSLVSAIEGKAVYYF